MINRPLSRHNYESPCVHYHLVNILYTVHSIIQWSIDGYFYPIQISQYALVAYTKNRSEETPPQKVISIMTKKNTKNCQWLESKPADEYSQAIQFDSTSDKPCSLSINESYKLSKLQVVS